MPLKLDIRLLIPALPFDPNDPFAKSLGGSETAGLQLAKAFAELGHTVTCFASVEESASWHKVNIVPAASFESTMISIPCDLCVVQRNPAAFMRRYESRVNLLWVHDLMFARRGPELQAAMHSVDRIMTVSQFQKDQWRKVVPSIPESSYVVARNGLDLDLVAAAWGRARRESGRGRRERGLIVCGARPERGIDVLLTQVFPRILKEVPHARLALAAYDCPNPATQGFYDQLRQIAANFGPERVTWHGALNKAELYDLYHRAELYLYPTPSPSDPSFAETSCISAMEAMACGCPVIASMRGGLVETVGGNGILIDVPEAHAATEGVVGRFVEEAAGLLADRDRWEELSRRGILAAAGLGWRPVAQQFVDTAVEILGGQCADPVRLARHFIRRQDIEAARMVLQRELPGTGEPQRSELREVEAWLTTRYEHTRGPERLAAYYDEAALGNQETTDVLLAAPPTRFDSQPLGRFEMIENALRAQLELPPYNQPILDRPPLRILDFGCNGGELAIVLGNRLGNAKVLGVDTSAREVERARKLADAKAKDPGNLLFAVQGETDLALIEDEVDRNGPFDAVVMAEVLEHLTDPVALIEKLERLVRRGGVVACTVPYGPWETQLPEPRRGEHLREWLAADLIDIFVKKPSLQFNIAPHMVCPTSGEMCGNNIWHYKVDHEALGRIDWDRKLTMQRPRQTLSACMILGGGNDIDNLHWCLKPVAAVADEIVVGDTGMSDEARRILRQYPGVRVVPDVPSPLVVGFDVARNRVLDQCREDWVLMVDADEHLLTPPALSRYLRECCFHSYAMPQFHFAVDAAWKPDLPGRLFRRRPDPEGRTVRFVGRLHEHPEFAVNEGAGMAMLLQDVRLAHVGYIEQANRAQRYMRNLPLLKLDMETHPERELIRLVMCRDTMIQAKYLMALAGIPAEPGQAQRHEMAALLCRDVIGIFDQTFVDNPSGMSNEAMEFYSEACKYLGTDVRADGLSVNRQGVGPAMGPTATWFASVDHYKRWMARSVRAATESLEVAGF